MAQKVDKKPRRRYVPLKTIQKRLQKAIDDVGSMRVFSNSINASSGYVSDVVNGRRAPGPKILNYLGLVAERETVVTFRYFVPD